MNKETWEEEFDEKFLEYDGKWIAKDEKGNCKSFTEKGFKNFIKQKLKENDEKWKKNADKLKKEYVEMIEFKEEKSEIYINGYNQALEDIKNKLK